MGLRAAVGLATVLAAAEVTGASESPTRAETQFRRRAAEFKKLRRALDKDNDWHRRCATALRWFDAHRNLITDGPLSCAELQNRLGPPDFPSPRSLDSWLPKGKYGSADAETKVLDYEATPQDDISSSLVRLSIFCSKGKATSVTFELRIGD